MGNRPSKFAGTHRNRKDKPVSKTASGFHGTGGQPTNGTTSKQFIHAAGNHEFAVSTGRAPSGGELPVTRQTSSTPTTNVSAGGVGQVATGTAQPLVQVDSPAVEKKKKDNTEKKLVALELGIQAMELIESAVGVTELALGNSNPVGELLKKVTGVLVMLKVS
jgi:hypothetical protein